MNRAYEYLKEAKTYFIATEDGPQPRVRPFGSLNIYEGKLYISTVKGKNVYDQMLANPRVELAAMGKDGWIRVTALAIEETDPTAKKALWAQSAARRGADPDKPDENSAVFYLKDASVTITRYGADPETFTF